MQLLGRYEGHLTCKNSSNNFEKFTFGMWVQPNFTAQKIGRLNKNGK